MDIVAKISKKFPSAVDNFAADIKRRHSLTDKNIEVMLTKIFNGIPVERLSPEMSWRHNRLKQRIW